MTVYLKRAFLTRFLDELALDPVRLEDNPPGAVWLDGLGRVNTCSIQEYLLNSPLKRISINKTGIDSSTAFLRCGAWANHNPTQPKWRLELTCLDSEASEFADWLAAVANRRERLIGRLPAPPHSLLNWHNPAKLDDYLYHLSSASIWSEAAFTEDIKWSRQQAPVVHDQPRILAISSAR